MTSSITHVEVFFEPGALIASLRAHGSTVSFLGGADRVVQKSISDADVYQHLDGELVRHTKAHPPEVTTVDRMEHDAWQQFLNSRRPGSKWERWFATTRDGRWNVVLWR